MPMDQKRRKKLMQEKDAQMQGGGRGDGGAWSNCLLVVSLFLMKQEARLPAGSEGRRGISVV